MSHLAPELTTERLRLRGYARDDFDWFDATWRSETVNRHIGGRPRSRAENWPRFLLNFGQWELFGYGFWMIEERVGGARVGIAGLMHAMRDIAAIDAYPEAGWVLADGAAGKGYGTEAMRAILAWGDAYVDTPQTGCIIDPGNAASINVARKLGYRPTGMASYQDGEIATFARPRGGDPIAS
jgi:RimJ/RimL family protein N-acetyltransferase